MEYNTKQSIQLASNVNLNRPSSKPFDLKQVYLTIQWHINTKYKSGGNLRWWRRREGGIVLNGLWLFDEFYWRGHFTPNLKGVKRLIISENSPALQLTTSFTVVINARAVFRLFLICLVRMTHFCSAHLELPVKNPTVSNGLTTSQLHAVILIHKVAWIPL
jgi:hypothetical protein